MNDLLRDLRPRVKTQPPEPDPPNYLRLRLAAGCDWRLAAQMIAWRSAKQRTVTVVQIVPNPYPPGFSPTVEFPRGAQDCCPSTAASDADGIVPPDA